ncbi:MAG: archaellin/type IV pilin N-terminal domain-containing protein [Candidatus Woesearchaeota archaeon]
MMNKKAETGIGTLILFIAMILVAAIAAGVLIQTATSLQNKALLTGDRTKGQVSTGLTTLLLYGTNGSDGTIEDFRQKIKLSPGSDPITMHDALIEFGVASSNVDLTYIGTNCTYYGSDCNSSYASNLGYCSDPDNDNGTFAVNYLVNGPNHQDGYLVRGDIAMLCFRGPSGVEEDKSIRISFIPKKGTQMTVETATPNIMTSERVYIFP